MASPVRIDVKRPEEFLNAYLYPNAIFHSFMRGSGLPHRPFSLRESAYAIMLTYLHSISFSRILLLRRYQQRASGDTFGSSLARIN